MHPLSLGGKKIELHTYNLSIQPLSGPEAWLTFLLGEEDGGNVRHDTSLCSNLEHAFSSYQESLQEIFWRFKINK